MEVVSLAGIKILNARKLCRACAEGSKVAVQLELMTVILEAGWLKGGCICLEKKAEDEV